MKTWKLTLVSLTLLATLLIGAAFIVLSAPQNLNAKVRWDPRSVVDKAPVWWDAEIRVAGGGGPNEIIPESILLEGQLSPHHTEEKRNTLVATFKGNRVLNIILPKIPHLAPGKYKVDLTITGLVEGDDGPLPFSGTGFVFVIITNPSPP